MEVEVGREDRKVWRMRRGWENEENWLEEFIGGVYKDYKGP